MLMIRDLEEKNENGKLKNTGWPIKRIHVVYLKSFTNKPVRGSSWIPTPDKYSNAKCGLINIQIPDDECLRWCAIYHQSLRDKNSHRITVLKKVDDKYSYDNVNFPASISDIEQFEHNNKIAVFVYSINQKDDIFREKLGNPEYFNNDVIYLLRLAVEEKSHIYT